LELSRCLLCKGCFDAELLKGSSLERFCPTVSDFFLELLLADGLVVISFSFRVIGVECCLICCESSDINSVIVAIEGHFVSMFTHISHVGDCAWDVLTCHLIIDNLTMLRTKTSMNSISLFLRRYGFTKLGKHSGGFFKSGSVISVAFRRVLMKSTQLFIPELDLSRREAKDVINHFPP